MFEISPLPPYSNRENIDWKNCTYIGSNICLLQGSLFYTETELNTPGVIIKKALKKIGATGGENFSGHLIHVMGALGCITHGHERISEVLSSLKIFT